MLLTEAALITGHIERREAERRDGFTRAAIRHAEQCERRKAERRANDNARVAAWLAAYHRARGAGL